MQKSKKSIFILIAALVVLLAGCIHIHETPPQDTSVADENVTTPPSPNSPPRDESPQIPDGAFNPEEAGLRPLDPNALPDGWSFDETLDFDELTPIMDAAGNIRMWVPDMTREDALVWYEMNMANKILSLRSFKMSSAS